MNRHEEEWAKSFKEKNETEILTAPLPPNLTDGQCVRFRTIQRDAAEAARQAVARAKEQALVRDALAHMSVATRAQPVPVPVASPPEAPQPGDVRALARHNRPLPFAIPTGKTDSLLDRQIASCSGIIEHLAHYVGRYDSAADTCNQFMDRICAMMKSSASVALAAGQLRGMPAEGRRR